jgi:isocitrate dehydrogenase
MLRHLKEYDAALLIEQAILVTLEQGIATKDIVGEKKALGTAEFADQVIAHLGQSSTFWKPRSYEPLQIPRISHQPDLVHVTERKVIGLDIYIESGETVDKIAENVTLILDQTLFQLVAISNRGVKVYPAVPGVNPDLVDHWCLRVAKKDPSALTDAEALELLGLISLKHSWMHIEKLTLFDHIPGFSKSQGED